jgi:hypothetical protein
VDYKGGPRYTPSDALARIAALPVERTLTEEERGLLDGLQGYLGERFGLAVVTDVPVTCPASQH